jgi:DMSO/TMAO reductase YedYZ molybdopterin-dependent catalytic subunit
VRSPTRLLTRPLPEPPAVLRHGPLRAGAFGSRLHDPATAARIGRWLGVAFATCFVTGLISHWAQQPPGWFALPPTPVWGYRLSQGIHVATGIACVPLLLAKLWTVYPRLWAWPPVRSLLHGLERLSVFVLVASAVFELASGLVNVAQWYPWRFFFPRAHEAVAWVAIGSILLHLAVKMPVIVTVFGRQAAHSGDAEPPDGAAAADLTAESGLTRRGLFWATGAAVAAVTVSTVGQTLTPLRRLVLLAPRRPDIGPQGLPVNRTAVQAGVRAAAVDPGYRLAVHGPRAYALTLAELRALPQYEASLPIACVEGWSVSARWRGVRVRDLLDRAGAGRGAGARVDSLERHGLYASSLLSPAHAAHPLTLLALEVDGRPLGLDHGYPLRLIAPDRPGVLQTKWVSTVEAR